MGTSIQANLYFRYHKTSPFGSYQQKFNRQPSEDLNIFVESSSAQENLHNPKNVSSNDLTRNLDGASSWQNASSAKEKDQTDEPSSKNVNLKLWRQNTGGNPYYKLWRTLLVNVYPFLLQTYLKPNIDWTARFLNSCHAPNLSLFINFT